MSNDSLRASTRLLVDTDALVRNWQRCVAAIPGRVGAAVKADGYGLGAPRVARALFRAGCEDFFVATLAEGLDLRRVLDRGGRIHVLEGFRHARDASAFAGARLQPVLNSVGQVEAWAHDAAHRPTPLPAALHVDTGMARLGLDVAEARTLLGDPARVAAAGICLLMTHLACADTPDDPMTAHQLDRFRELRALAPHLPVSIGNSAGTLLGAESAGDLARPGIGLYGGNPFSDGRPSPVEPVVRWQADVLQVRWVPPGTPVGYAGTFVTSRSTRIATIGAGYADGYPRIVGNRAVVGVDVGVDPGARGMRAPVIGRVSMDLVTADVTDIPEWRLVPGDRVDLVGGAVSLDEFAGWADTIAYEVLTGISPRVPRVSADAAG